MTWRRSIRALPQHDEVRLVPHRWSLVDGADWCIMEVKVREVRERIHRIQQVIAAAT